MALRGRSPSGLSFMSFERYELEGERLVGEFNLHDREGACLAAAFLHHADLLDPEPAAGFCVIHVEHANVSDLHRVTPRTVR